MIGYFNQLYYWNLDRGVPHSYREIFDYVFILSNGETLEYTGSSRALLSTSVELSESERVPEDIRFRLRKSIPSVEVLEDFPGRDIRVVGHTDSTGPEEYNRSLSMQRARRVARESR